MSSSTDTNMSMWLAEDPELLRAALEIIDTWGVESLGSAASSSPMSCSDSEGSTEKSDSGDEKVLRPKRARLPTLDVRPLKKSAPEDPSRLKPSTVSSTHHRRREEIMFLREQASELESQLAELEQAKCSPSADAPAKEEAASSEIWHDIVNRQRQLRQRSEAEQRKLRQTLEDQLKVARGLIKLMQKARRMENEELLQPSKRTIIPSSTLEIGDNMRSHIQSVYSNMDQWFSFSKFHDGSKKFFDLNLIDDREDEIVIEVREAWILPFPVDKVLDALWLYLKNKYNGGLCAPEFVLDGELTMDSSEMTSQFSAVATIGNTKTTFDGRAMARRFSRSGDKPSSIVSTLQSSPATQGVGLLVHMEENSCIRVLPGICDGWDIKDYSVVRVQCSQHFKITFDNGAAGREHAGVLSQCMLRKLREGVEVVHETIETLLLTNPSR